MSDESKGSRRAPGYASSLAILGFLLFIILLAGITALVLYLVYRPSKPHFDVIGASVFQLSNTSAAAPANAISTNMQFTIVIHNPNDRAEILYDRMSAYVAYHGQPITPPAPLPPLAQDSDSTVSVAPVFGGSFIPVSPDVAAGIANDQQYGVVPLRLVILGRVKYKPGPFRSAWVHMYVKCDMLLGIRKGTTGQVPMLGAPNCDVDT